MTNSERNKGHCRRENEFASGRLGDYTGRVCNTTQQGDFAKVSFPNGKVGVIYDALPVAPKVDRSFGRSPKVVLPDGVVEGIDAAVAVVVARQRQNRGVITECDLAIDGWKQRIGEELPLRPSHEIEFVHTNLRRGRNTAHIAIKFS